MINEEQRTTIVIVGHVDHGKSTLLGRLLLETGNLPQEKIDEIEKASADQGRRFEYAFLTDQFHEERSANVTIDTAQVFLNLKDRPFLIVDAPGHKEFLKNMISGTSYAKNALLMLDVKEGIREQTERHAQILHFMGISRIAVVINKMDLVDYSQDIFKEKKSEVEKVLAAHHVFPKFVIPASSYFGENIAKPSEKMNWYKEATVLDFFLGCVADTPYSSEGSFCFPVQMSFGYEGRNVALGRVEQGRVQSGDNVKVFPGGQSGSVERIVRHQSPDAPADAGSSIALMVSGINTFARGNIILSSEVVPKPATEVVCQLLWASDQPLKVGDDVIVECRSQQSKATVRAIGEPNEGIKHLENGDIQSVNLNIQENIFLSVPNEIPSLSKVVLHHNNTLSGCAIVSKLLVLMGFVIGSSSSAFAYIDPGTGVTFATGILGWVIGFFTVAAGGALFFLKKGWGKLKERFHSFMKNCGF